MAAAGTLGVADFAGGLAGRRTPPPGVAIGVELTGLVAVLPLAFVLLPARLDVTAAALTFAGGAAGGIGLVLFYRAMAMNLIGVVAPISAVVTAALPVGAGVLLGGERLHLGQFAGIAAGLAAIALINADGGVATKDARTAVALAVLAGVGFGLFLVLFHAGSSAGVTAFVSGRIGSVTAALCFALITRTSFVPRAGALRLIALSGTLDGVGVVLYLYATFHGLLSLSALLTSFYPAFTTLCARIVIKERLTAMQAAGAALAVVSIALIAAT